MRKWNGIFIGLGLIVTLSAQTPTIDIQALDNYFEQSRVQWHVPGMAVAVVKDHQVLLAKGYGERQLGSGEAVNDQTIFNIGSTSKAFTAMAMAILVDEGKVQWDDRVVDHMPQFQLSDPFVTQQMRVRDLFTHNLGLPNTDYFWAGLSISPDEILYRMRYVPMAYPLRGGYIYQNIMYLAAGKLIEILSGKSWADFVQERIFQPLGMRNTYPTKARSQVQSNRSVPHHYAYGTGPIVPIPDANADSIAPAGAIWSCIADMSKWVVSILDSSKYDGGRLVKPMTWMELFQPGAIVPANEFYPTAKLTGPKWTTYAKGWFQEDYHGMGVDFHTGSLGGTIAQIGLIRKDGIGYYFLANLDHAEVRHALMYRTFDVLSNTTDPLRDWSSDFLQLYGSAPERMQKALDKMNAERLTDTKPRLALAGYTGTFHHTIWGDIKLTVADGKLTVVSPETLSGPLEHWHLDTFHFIGGKNPSDAKYWMQSITFQFNSQGKIASLNLGSFGTFDKVN
ncbi:MAG: serine hydrolase [Saprospiraceae bacterium]|nr:serine hydrolase [Saprospiraceae bacterium]